MAITKSIETASLSIEVQSGTDAADNPTFAKKTFSNVKTDASPQNIFDVAEAIKSGLKITISISGFNPTISHIITFI